MQVSAPATDTAPPGLSLPDPARLRRWAGLLTSLLAGQGAVQLLNVVTGFFLLRWLSVEAYAQFSIAFGFQSTLQWLAELGAGHSIVALTGDRGADRKTVGRYIRSALHFRKRLLLAVIPLAAVAFPLMTAKHDWGWGVQALLFVSVVGAVVFQGRASYYATPLLIHRRLGRFYRPQIFTAIGRLAVCFFLHLTSLLTSWTTAWTNSAVIAVQGWFYRRRSREWASVPRRSDPGCDREMRDYILPQLPWLIFTAFQGQISLLLATVFGQTRNIAEIAALGRLGQLFLILSTANSVLVAPYIAKVDGAKLARRYLQILCFAVAISLSLTVGAFAFPDPLLWILGAKYQNLRLEIGWAVAVACVGYVNTVMMTMHSARKWVYWWWGILHIFVVLAAQAACILLLDLSSTFNVLYFSLISSGATLAALILGGAYGFSYGPPKSLVRS